MFDDRDLLPVRGEQDPLGVVHQLVEVGDRAGSLLGRADERVAGAADDLLFRCPNHRGSCRIDTDDLVCPCINHRDSFPYRGVDPAQKITTLLQFSLCLLLL